MNNQSPLVPQGSLLEQRNKGRARVKIAVFVVLAIHGVGLLALLMQGCKKEPETTAAPAAEETNAAPAAAVAEQTNTPPPFTNPVAAANSVVTNTDATPAPVTTSASAPATAATEYKVVQGDKFSTIARKFHTTTKALMEANPGVSATKLQIGQTLHIPSATTVASTTSGTVAAPAESTPGAQVYSVQSGDNLTKIASRFKVTVRALRSANHLSTDRLTVGQKLTIPTKAGGLASLTSNNSAPSPVQ